MASFREPYDRAFAAINQPGSPFEVQRRNLDGIDALCYCNAPTTLPQLLSAARAFGDRPFVSYREESFSFAQYFAQVDRLSLALIGRHGISKGDRVGIAMRNYPEWLVSWVAIVSIGAVVVPLNSFDRGRELRQNLDDAGVRLLICDEQRLAELESVDWREPCILVRGQRTGLPGHCITWEQAIADMHIDNERLATAAGAIDGDDRAMIMYTSGTTGRPKGAVFSHRNCCQSVVNLEAVGALAYITNKDAFDRQLARGIPPKALIAVPLFHVSGLYAQFLLNLRGGRAMLLMHKWNAPEACELIERERITTVVAAPSMVQELLDCPRFASIDASSVSNISGAGAASPKKLHEQVARLLPGALGGAGWGMTESGASGSSFTGYFVPLKPASAGFVQPVVELRFCDEDGKDVGSAEPGGEMWIRSPCVISGYLHNEEANRALFRDGWFRTGDIGYLDGDGCLHVYARAKDMVIRGGENIFPVEVEHCIQELPGVVLAAAFAVPSEAYGEELAVVVQHDGSREPPLMAEDIQRHCAARLAPFKVPSFVRLTTEALPLNAVNKVLKQKLREQYFAAGGT